VKEIVIFGSYCNTKEKLAALEKSITDAKALNLDVLVFGRYPIPEKTQKLCDYWIFDKSNPVMLDRALNHWCATHGKYISNWFYDYGYAALEQIVKTLGFDIHNKDITIDNDTLETQKEKVIEILNSREYKTLFNCGKRIIKKDRFSLNGLLDDYGLKINSELHRKQINKVQTKFYSFKLSNLDFINEYYKRVNENKERENNRISSCEFLDD
jgi:hypothetical protein